ncbi:hypothetical protein Q3A80_30310 [Burkholderia sp. SR8]|uniref:nSTAND3 domain-containing NTPase n=1 Tax=Burkholderia sp. SR8 TaxID=3062277 RepID=UPI004063F142
MTITREILGQTVQSFLDVNDGGRDGAFCGSWTTQKGETLSGKFVIQCKFTNRPGYSLTASDLSDEFGKAKALVDKGLCDAYILLTNAGISGATDEKIHAALKNSGVKQSITYGSNWLEEQIKSSKRLRMLVPRVYGLGDLSQILDDRAYKQAKAVLDSMHEELAKVVITDAYTKAAHAIDTHGFVLLIGEPAAGKSTIAAMLAMAAADKYESSVIKITRAELLMDRWNTEENSQFFWVDDAFGSTQYENNLALEWNSKIPEIRAAIKGGAKIVLTSRDYIYNAARRDLKASAFPLLNESQVVVDVHALTLAEKQQILYNHLKFGSQSKEFLKLVKPFLGDVADHPRFIPEMARRLSDPLFTKSISTSESGLKSFIENREQLLSEIIEGLDIHSRSALALIYMRKDDLRSPIELDNAEENAIIRMGSSLGACISALEALKGSLVSQAFTDGEPSWKFRHPTVGDAFATLVRKNIELLEIYVRGTSPARLMQQVTCGDVGIKNAVVLPSSMHFLMIDKLDEFVDESNHEKPVYQFYWSAKTALHNFLVRRCSKSFLEKFLTRHPELPSKIHSPGLYLDAVSEVSVAIRLHQEGLFPPSSRLIFVDKVSDYAIRGRDLSALSDKDLRSVFTNAEYQNVLNQIKLQLIPKLSDVRNDATSGYDSSEEPNDYVAPYTRTLDILEECFPEDEAILGTVNVERRRIDKWIDNQFYEESSGSDETDGLGTLEDTIIQENERSIFDDVDE